MFRKVDVVNLTPPPFELKIRQYIRLLKYNGGIIDNLEMELEFFLDL